ncbi:hypothetical protein ES703_04360 [subsurface metagenome]
MKKKREIIYSLSKKSMLERKNRTGERTSIFDEDKEIISLEDAEREAMAVIRRRMHYKIENLIIESSNITQVGDRYAYEIRARVDTPQSRGRLRRGKVETQNVEVLIDASSGECIGFSTIELEE